MISFFGIFEERYSNRVVQFLANISTNYNSEYESEVGRVFSVMRSGSSQKNHFEESIYDFFGGKFEERYSNRVLQFLANISTNYDSEYESAVGRIFSVMRSDSSQKNHFEENIYDFFGGEI